MRASVLSSALASAFLAGEQTLPEILARGHRTLGREWPWLRPLVTRYVQEFRRTPRHREVESFIASSRFFRFALKKFREELRIASWIAESSGLRPVALAEAWNLPRIDHLGALADWLAVDFSHLEWFADLKGIGYKTLPPKLEHYSYRLLTKPGGSLRLIEAPKRTLKELQRRILTGILDNIPPHPAAHGFVHGRSIRTFVAPHVAKRALLRMDLKDFFPNLRTGRIEAFFRTLGYPEPVAQRLTGICTNAAPRSLWEREAFDPSLLFEVHSLYRRPHLPQGAPTSPALANACAYRMDCRLSALARAVGGRYTRYADDLAFSADGDLAHHPHRFAIRAAAIAMEEGFEVNHRKTRVMRCGVRQHLASITVNRHLNVNRTEFDSLKAILTNCARHGPISQNREGRTDFRAHLAGRVNFVAMINPQKGARLRKLLEKIAW